MTVGNCSLAFAYWGYGSPPCHYTTVPIGTIDVDTLSNGTIVTELARKATTDSTPEELDLYLNFQGDAEIPDENLQLQIGSSEFVLDGSELDTTTDLNDYHWDDHGQTWENDERVTVKIIERITCP